MKRLLSTILLAATVPVAMAQTVQFTLKATSQTTLQLFFRPQGNIGPMTTGISNLTFVLQIPQSFSDPQGSWAVSPNSSYLGAASTTTSSSTSNGNRYNTLFSWTSNPNIANTTFADSTEYLLATITTPVGVSAGDITLIDWGNNRLDNATSGAPIWATSLAIDGVDKTNNSAIFYGNPSSNSPVNSGTATAASTLTLNGTPLSVALRTFTGVFEQGVTTLKWELTQPQDARKMSVEYSADGKSWSVAGIVSPFSTENNYSFLHRPAAQSGHFYRLLVEENNGHSFYSRTLYFTDDPNRNTGIVLYPSVLSRGTTLQIVLPGSATPVQIHLTDATGKLIKSFTSEEKYIQFNTSSLTSGNYFVVVLSGQAVYTSKFLVL